MQGVFTVHACAAGLAYTIQPAAIIRICVRLTPQVRICMLGLLCRLPKYIVVSQLFTTVVKTGVKLEQ